jgi:hypothetical protein
LPQQVVRSTGRIPKEIPILLIGSDLDGRVFSEHTKTVLLSLHGAGLLSRHKLSPEQELILRWPERNKETEIRVVGHVGSVADVHTYGVSFFDPQLNFWEIDFPPVSPLEKEMGLLSLACHSCGTLEEIGDSGIEADICATGDGVIRFCRKCGTSTLWKPAQLQNLPAENPLSPSPVNGAQLGLFPSSAPPAPDPPAPPMPATFALPLASSSPPPLVTPVSQISFYATSRSFPQAPAPAPPSAHPADPVFPDSARELRTEPRATVLTLPPPARAHDAPRVERRQHPRAKVSYSACVRHPERGDDIVQCEDMSRGGLRFKSKKQYYERSLIEIAVPYVAGQTLIFVPAQIVSAVELPSEKLFRYGVAYLNRPKPATNSF